MSLAKKQASKIIVELAVNPFECPFREFKDAELSPDFWGMDQATFRAALHSQREKKAVDTVWEDLQIQPLPRSVRHYMHGWIRAEELAMSRWQAEVVIFDDADGGRIPAADYLVSHAQVISRSAFSRRVLSICFMLERNDGMQVEHLWDGFSFNIGPEGWRPKFHIYSPGLKAGGGPQHRPIISKNGCYLIRLFYLGVWRCVWVNDLVPIDATGAPLLPFSPLLPRAMPKPSGPKQQPSAVTAKTVHLWPLLICKALLKLAAPDMDYDESELSVEDETMEGFDIFHAFTGGIGLTWKINDKEDMWNLLIRDLPVFSWDDDDETVTNGNKGKPAKKPATKEAVVPRRGSLVSVSVVDTKDKAPYIIPGVTPAHEMVMLITMARDVPLKRPLPEPEVPFWKIYRWVDWARAHGLYEPYECPRTKFIKCSSLLKLSYAPHLLDIQSTESITFENKDVSKKAPKEAPPPILPATLRLKEELREWILYDAIFHFIQTVNVVYFPSLYQFSSIVSAPAMHPNKTSTNKCVDLQMPKTSPLYIQIDSPEEINLRVSFSVLHPRVLFNCGVIIEEYIEAGYLFLEEFEWFVDPELHLPNGFLKVRGYDCLETSFLPGRHYLRVWVESRLNWQSMLVTDANLLVGSRDQIQAAAVKECPWSSKFLLGVGTTFLSWVRGSKSVTELPRMDTEFYKTYSPDLPWEKEVVGYPRAWVHWMFRKALQSLLAKRLAPNEYRLACNMLRRLFYDPDFGLSDKPAIPGSLRQIIDADPCDCDMSVSEEVIKVDDIEVTKEEEEIEGEQKPLLDAEMEALLLKAPEFPNMSTLCDFATEELPCGILRTERERLVRRHEAATCLQSYWRRTRAQKYLSANLNFSSDILKAIMDSAFGNLEALSALMNEFFQMFPGTRTAYSVASALSGVYGLQQHSGTTPVTPKLQCKWIPLFQGIFHCHHPVLVAFDLHSNIHHETFSVFNNDTSMELEHVINAPITYEFIPNVQGYTVVGHASMEKASGVHMEVHWLFTVLSSLEGVFHVCDDADINFCKEQPMQMSSKLQIEEIFIPNRRNILGGIQLAVLKYDVVSFRAAASSPEIDLEAILRSTNAAGEIEILGKCKGKGEIFWPFIGLQPPVTFEPTPTKVRSSSHVNLLGSSTRLKSDRTIKAGKSPKAPSSAKGRLSLTKIPEPSKPKQPEAKVYVIEVIVPDGWPLSMPQWLRVEEVRNSYDVKPLTTDGKEKKPKVGSAKEKDVKNAAPLPQEPQPGDAYTELEVSLTIGGGIVAKRDDERELAFFEARRLWDAKEPGRNLKGAVIRSVFRDEYLVPPPPEIQSVSLVEETLMEEVEMNEQLYLDAKSGAAPTPISEILMEEMTEIEEETLFLELPEQLRDKFEPLHFVPLCTKEATEDKVLLTPEKAEAAKTARLARYEAAIERMHELQRYNEIHIIGRQRKRCILLENTNVDCVMNPQLVATFNERDDVVMTELGTEIKGKKK